jgi:hypothetical protein
LPRRWGLTPRGRKQYRAAESEQVVTALFSNSSSYKVHARAVAGDSLCGAIGTRPKGTWTPILTDNASEVSCARCLRMLRMVTSMNNRESSMRSHDRKDKV